MSAPQVSRHGPGLRQGSKHPAPDSGHELPSWTTSGPPQPATGPGKQKGTSRPWLLCLVSCLPLALLALATCGRQATWQACAPLKGHTDKVLAVAFAPDNKTLATGGKDQTVKLWDVATGQCQKTLRGHEAWITAVAVTDDGKLLASASLDRTVKLWDVVTGRLRYTLRGHRDGALAVAFAPDGRTVATTNSWGTITLWDTSTGKARATLTRPNQLLCCLAFAPDGQTLSAGTFGGTVELWDVAAGRLRARLAGHTHRLWRLAYAPDGKTLTTASADHVVKVWDAARGQLCVTFKRPRDSHRTEVYAPDGTELAPGVPCTAFDQAEIDTELVQATLEGFATVEAHARWVYAVKLASDGRMLAAGTGEDGTVLLWKRAPGSRLRARLPRSRGPVPELEPGLLVKKPGLF